MRLALYFLLVQLAAGPTIAQTIDTTARVQNIIDVSRQHVRSCLKRFRPHLDSRADPIYAEGAVRVRAVADFNAFIDYDANQISLPVAPIIEAYYLMRAAQRLSRDPSLLPRFQPYLDYLSRRSEDARRRGVDNMAIREFWDFLGETPSQASRIEMDPEFIRIANDGAYDAICVVLAHEIGHLVLRHKPTDQVSAKTSRAQERQADNFAARLAQKADISLIPASTIFLRFAFYEKAYGGGSFAVRTHPLPECRVYRLQNTELRRALLSSTERRKIERVLGKPAGEIESDWNDLADHCEEDDK